MVALGMIAYRTTRLGPCRLDGWMIKREGRREEEKDFTSRTLSRKQIKQGGSGPGWPS